VYVCVCVCAVPSVSIRPAALALGSWEPVCFAVPVFAMPPSAAAAAPSTSAVPGAEFSTTTSSPPLGAYTAPKAAALLSSRFRERNRDFARPNPDDGHQRESERSVLDTPASSQPAAAPASSAQHKPLAAVHRTSYTTFPPSTLLRPSSLLPALRIAVDSTIPDTPGALDDPFHDLTPHAPEPAKEHDPPGRRGHSRSTSAGGLSDSLRNLNRWSASTTSSRASNLTNFTRRVSSEVITSAFHSPGRKLHKHKSSTASDSPRHEPVAPLRSESPPPVPIPPLKSLPRISTGPSLEEEVRGTNVLERLSPIPQYTHARRPSDDPGLYWDGTNEELGLSPPRTLDRAEPSMSHAATAGPGINMPYTQSREARGHSRSRSAGANGVVVEPSSRHRERDRAGRPPSQRAMLSRALEKANTAVQLDNAQNVEGARLAYLEACGLLQQVLQRTAGKEDRDKLEAIVRSV
jgi:hypothetical protein